MGDDTDDDPALLVPAASWLPSADVDRSKLSVSISHDAIGASFGFGSESRPPDGQLTRTPADNVDGSLDVVPELSPPRRSSEQVH